MSRTHAATGVCQKWILRIHHGLHINDVKYVFLYYEAGLSSSLGFDILTARNSRALTHPFNLLTVFLKVLKAMEDP